MFNHLVSQNISNLDDATTETQVILEKVFKNISSYIDESNLVVNSIKKIYFSRKATALDILSSQYNITLSNTYDLTYIVTNSSTALEQYEKLIMQSTNSEIYSTNLDYLKFETENNSIPFIFYIIPNNVKGYSNNNWRLVLIIEIPK